MGKLEEYFEQFNNMDFPLYTLTEQALKESYQTLINNRDPKPRANTAIEIVTSAHPSVWTCNVFKHKSPAEAWYTPELLYKTIANRLKYVGENLTPKDIIHGFSVTKVAPRVSLFRPALAKYLVNKYLADYNTIFDPCAGFSGRMLGVCSLGKHYTGQDCNWCTIQEATKLRDQLNLDAELTYKNSIYDKGSYDCLFTCPPYMNKTGDMIEIWNEEIEPLSEDEWIDTCLTNFMCEKYLFVVGTTEKYKDYIVETISNKSHFSNKMEFVIYIDKSKTK